MPPFIVYALPRSRTAWAAKFLSYRDWYCGHDELQHMRSLDDIRAWFTQPNTGTVETAAAPFWRLARTYCPEAGVAIIRRPIPEVVDSLRRAGVPGDTALLTRAMEVHARKLDQIERRIPDALTITFDELRGEDACARLFAHCLPYAPDPAWWEKLADENVQINMAALLRYVAAYKPQLDKLAGMAKQTILSGLAVRQIAGAEGLVIAAEPFEDFYRDSGKLFAEHLVEVGEAPDAYSTKNLPLMRVLEKLGGLQVVTARCNGRVFGYLMSLIGPSLEREDIKVAMHTTFFASPDFPGLGLKLQRASIRMLKERGVSEVLLRAGPRGSGPRMSALYRRCGAVPDGELFKIAFEGD
jgi:hypothetical protein